MHGHDSDACGLWKKLGALRRQKWAPATCVLTRVAWSEICAMTSLVSGGLETWKYCNNVKDAPQIGRKSDIWKHCNSVKDALRIVRKREIWKHCNNVKDALQIVRKTRVTSESTATILKTNRRWWGRESVRGRKGEKSSNQDRPPDEGSPWWAITLWKTTLMKVYPYERKPWWETTWWKTTLMRGHPDEGPTWWMTTLVRDHLMKDHPDERPPWWGTIW